MCGIVGYVGSKPLVPVLMDGLRRLEYRGYDSAGVAVVRDGELRHPPQRRQALAPRGRARDASRSTGEFGIGHTRWATHGRPTEENAHPHRDCRGRIVVVHNGIIENYLELKQRADRARAHRSSPRRTRRSSRTWSSRRCGDDGLAAAVRRALTQLRGLFALVLISADDPRHDRRRAQRPARRRRPGRGRVLRRVGHSRHSQPHARRRVPRRRRDGDRHARGRGVHRLLTAKSRSASRRSTSPGIR